MSRTDNECIVGFCCGSFGCLPIFSREDEYEEIERERKKWAVDYLTENHRWPSLPEQNSFIEAAIRRRSISVAKKTT